MEQRFSYGVTYGAKRSFCKAFNAIFGEVGRVTSEVIVQLLKSKC